MIWRKQIDKGLELTHGAPDLDHTVKTKLLSKFQKSADQTNDLEISAA